MEGGDREKKIGLVLGYHEEGQGGERGEVELGKRARVEYSSVISQTDHAPLHTRPGGSSSSSSSSSSSLVAAGTTAVGMQMMGPPAAPMTGSVSMVDMRMVIGIINNGSGSSSSTSNDDDEEEADEMMHLEASAAAQAGGAGKKIIDQIGGGGGGGGEAAAAAGHGDSYGTAAAANIDQQGPLAASKSNIALSLSMSTMATSLPSPSPLTLTSPTATAIATATIGSNKRGRGRPRGSGRRQLLATLGEWLAYSAGGNFAPHVITVAAGEDVAVRLRSLSQKGPRGICILSANGAISNVTLRQPGSSGGTLTFEGRFEILSLSGSFTITEDDSGMRRRTGGLSVSLAGPDGRVVGGGVTGLLLAATPIQVVVGSFLPNIFKEHKKRSKPDSSSCFSPVLPTSSGVLTAAKPISQSNPNLGGDDDDDDDNDDDDDDDFYDDECCERLPQPL